MFASSNATFMFARSWPGSMNIGSGQPFSSLCCGAIHDQSRNALALRTSL